MSTHAERIKPAYFAVDRAHVGVNLGFFTAVTSTLYLGGEVSVKDALAVEVVKPSGNVQGQTDSGAP